MNQTHASTQDGNSLDALVAGVVDEFRDRQKRGEQPDVEEYAARHPEAADLLRKVLATFQMLEGSGFSAGQELKDKAPDEAPLTGTLGDFRLLREVGRGGMGIVYEAEQISLGRRIALKVLPFAATLDPRQLQRFHNEARAAASLHHEHIVPVYAVGQERGIHFFAMQFIDGQTVADLIRQQKGGAAPAAADAPTTAPGEAPSQPADTDPVAGKATAPAPRDAAYFRRIAEWGIQAAEALEHAHTLGIVHRDIKPGNLMIDAHGHLWVADFGLARRAAESDLTMSGDLLGTLRYMSPEQALAKHDLVDHRSDVYSLGATLYEMLTLHPAAGGKDRQDIIQQITQTDATSLRHHDRRIPADLETIVLKALAKEPEGRYATAKELAEDLRRYLGHEPIRARRPTVIHRARKWAQRNRAVVAGAAMVVAIAFLGLIAITVLVVQHNENLAKTNDDLRIAQINEDRERRKAEQAWQAEAESRRLVEDAFLRSLRILNTSANPKTGPPLLAPVVMREAYEILLDGSHVRVVEDRLALLELRWEIARAQLELGKLQIVRQGPGKKLLGDAKEQPRDLRAASTLIATKQFFRRLAVEYPGDQRFRDSLIEACSALATEYRYRREDANEGAALEEAVGLANELVRDFPNQESAHWKRANILLQLADWHHQAGRYDNEIDTCAVLLDAHDAWLGRKPSNAAGRNPVAKVCNRLHKLAYVHAKAGRFDEAVQTSARIIAIRESAAAKLPKDSKAQVELGHAYRGFGKDLYDWKSYEASAVYSRKAVPIWERNIAEHPKNEDLVYQLALLHHQAASALVEAGRVKEALDHGRLGVSAIDQYFEAEPSNVNKLEAILKFGWLFMQAEDTRQVDAICARALAAWTDETDRRPDHIRLALRCSLGSLLWFAKRYDEAELNARRAVEDCKKLETVNPLLAANSPEIRARCRNQLAWLLATCPVEKLRNPVEAVAFAHKATEIQPNVGDNWNTLGVAYYRAGDWAQCHKTLEKSVALRAGGDPFDWFFLAMAHWQLGEKTRGREVFDKAVAWMEIRLPDNQELIRFREEAANLMGATDVPGRKKKISVGAELQR